MHYRLCLLLFLLFVSGNPSFAQSSQDGLLQINDPVHHFLLRQQAAGRLPGAFLLHQPLSTYEARRYLDTLAAHRDRLSRTDQGLLDRFRGTQPAPGAAWVNRRLGFLYANGHDFFSVRHPDYAFQLNPLLYLAYGQARQTATVDRGPTTPYWQNTRGVEASGHVGPIFFEARLEENQRREVWPVYEDNTAPRLGFTKFDSTGRYYDYFLATGVVGYRSKYFEVRFGRDRNRWGQGLGSLLLSNYAPVYDQLQLRTTFWRLQYTNLFTAFTIPGPDTDIFPFSRKYGAFHSLALDLPGGVQIALSEAVIFASDTLGIRSGFDLSYLNPIIFYRALEHDQGSPDNTLLGLDLSWNVLAGLRVYGQLVADELTMSRLGGGWWGNKYGWMAGAFIVNPGISGLSLRMEYARLRPYLYTHHHLSKAFVHFNDVLGHPAGPNAEDVLVTLDYQPAPRWQGHLLVSFTRRGRDTESINYGSDPTRNYDTRSSDWDVHFLQGVRQTTLLAEANAGYELLPSLYLEGGLRIQIVNDAEQGREQYVLPFALLRWGLPYQRVRY